MSCIRATATHLPPYEYDQQTILQWIRRWLGPRGERLGRILEAFHTGLVERRRGVITIEHAFQPRGFGTRNDEYIEAVTSMGEAAVRKVLDRAGIEPSDVDHFITSSCTGFMIPSVDAILAHRLGMKPSLSRLPITQHGCAGGAVALRQAHEHLLAFPGDVVLVMAAEAPSVTFQLEDFSPENVLSAALFGDGAAAAVLTGEGGADDPHILGAESRMFPDSAHLMGWKVLDSGLKIILTKEVPEAVRVHAPEAIRSFLGAHGLGIGDVRHYLLHPGGRKIIEGFEELFGFQAGELDITRRVLARHGNLSSATILFILDEALREGRGSAGDFGLLVAFGPGFGCESLLLRWGVEAPRIGSPALPATARAR